VKGEYMSQVRLRTNLIFDGKHYAKGSVVALKDLPVKFRGEEYCCDVEDKGGMVLLIADVSYMMPVQRTSGGPIHMQQTAYAGSVIELASLPKATREWLVPNEHYLTDWDEDERIARMTNPYADAPNTWDRLSELRVQDQFGKPTDLS
jgi:hypothetical protein